MGSQVPDSLHAIVRIVLDTIIGGFVTGLPVYIATNNLKTSTLTGILAAAKVLQSRLAPDLESMNRARAVEKATPVVVTEEGTKIE